MRRLGFLAFKRLKRPSDVYRLSGRPALFPPPRRTGLPHFPVDAPARVFMMRGVARTVVHLRRKRVSWRPFRRHAPDPVLHTRVRRMLAQPAEAHV
jgi:hypothetical protein